MNIPWGKIALNLPTIIGVAMDTVEKVKGKKGPEKEAAVVASVLEDLAGKFSATDVITDPALAGLLKEYIAARVALLNFMAAKS